jgi:hypothetical protein
MFRGWGLDFIGEIHPGSSKGHRFILVAMDYFTKWTEVVPLRNMTHRDVISFVQEHIIYRFGVPQTLTTDQGSSFMSHQFREFTESMKIKLLNSSPYYVQANSQAEASNKVLIKIIKKRIKDNPRRWHEKLSEALLAHRILRHGAIKVSPFELVYGPEVVLPVEIGLQSLRVTGQGSLSSKEYYELMMDKIDDVPESRFKALEEIEKEKIKISKAYNKRVLEKLFQVGDLTFAAHQDRVLGESGSAHSDPSHQPSPYLVFGSSVSHAQISFPPCHQVSHSVATSTSLPTLDFFWFQLPPPYLRFQCLVHFLVAVAGVKLDSSDFGRD